jgi:hypothetical protein
MKISMNMLKKLIREEIEKLGESRDVVYLDGDDDWRSDFSSKPTSSRYDNDEWSGSNETRSARESQRELENAKASVTRSDYARLRDMAVDSLAHGGHSSTSEKNIIKTIAHLKKKGF